MEDDQISNIPDNLWDLGHRFKRPFDEESKA